MNNPCIDCLTFPMCRERLLIKLKEVSRFSTSDWIDYYLYLAIKYNGCLRLVGYYSQHILMVKRPSSRIMLSPANASLEKVILPKIHKFITEIHLDKEIKSLPYNG